MMPEKNEGEAFRYTYSAKEQEELLEIRQKYMPQEKSSLEQLRRLDQNVTKKGTIAALVTGILGTLVLGLGMSCTMVWANTLFVPGVIIGLFGLAGVFTAYPLYLHITKKQREKLTPEIMRLTEELMQ